MSQELEAQLIALANAWDRAMVTNDADAIGQYMADDWTIVGTDGSMSDKPTFLQLIRSGALSHNEMTSADFRIRIYDQTAVLLSRGVSGGHYQGQAFREHEQSTNLFVQQQGRWRCVLTHLSKVAGP